MAIKAELLRKVAKTALNNRAFTTAFLQALAAEPAQVSALSPQDSTTEADPTPELESPERVDSSTEAQLGPVAITQVEFLARRRSKNSENVDRVQKLLEDKILEAIRPTVAAQIRSVTADQLAADNAVSLSFVFQKVVSLPQDIEYLKTTGSELGFKIDGVNRLVRIDLQKMIDNPENGIGALVEQSLGEAFQASGLLRRSMMLSSEQLDLRGYDPADTDDNNFAITFSLTLKSKLVSLDADHTRHIVAAINAFDGELKDVGAVTHTLVCTKNMEKLRSTRSQPKITDGKLSWPTEPYFQALINEKVSNIVVNGGTHILTRAIYGTVVETAVNYVLSDVRITEAGVAVTFSSVTRVLTQAECMPQVMQDYHLNMVGGNQAIVSKSQRNNAVVEAFDSLRAGYALGALYGIAEKATVSLSRNRLPSQAPKPDGTFPVVGSAGRSGFAVGDAQAAGVEDGVGGTSFTETI